MYRRKFKPNPDFPRQGQRWTDEERDDLFKEVHEMSVEEISKVHQRTPSAIIAQIGARVAKLIADGMDEEEACESLNFSTENYKKYCEIQEKYNKAKTESATRYVKQSEYQAFKEWQKTQQQYIEPSSSNEKTIHVDKYTQQQPKYTQQQPPKYKQQQQYQEQPPPKYKQQPPPPPKYNQQKSELKPIKLQNVPRPWTPQEQTQFIRDMKEQRTMGELAKKYNRSIDDLHGQLMSVMLSKKR